MKRLFLIRHAKSDWGDPGLDDIQRPLNDRGKSDAILMGEKLKEKFSVPDVVISSPAKRAIKTAQRITETIGFAGNASIVDSLYEFEVPAYYRAVEQLSDKARTAFLFGHNTVISEFAKELIGEFIGVIPTCAVVVVDLEIDSWLEITAGCGKKVDYLYPKMFNE
jgi:phosphohistidine phosphatase